MSTTTPILPTTAPNRTTAATTAAQTALPTAAGSSQSLSQADFLKIMVAQFTTQDPLSAGGSGGSSSSGTSDYVNELMSMTNLTTIQNMSSLQSQQLASTLPGATVQLNVNGKLVEGPVESAGINNGAVYVQIGGVHYPTSDLISVTHTAAQASAPAPVAASSTTTTP